MRLRIGTNEDEAVIRLVQDGDDIDIMVDGVLIAWFSKDEDGELYRLYAGCPYTDDDIFAIGKDGKLEVVR